MATFELTNQPILRSSAQILVLPVNSSGTILDPIIARCKTLYPDNYQTYRRRCIDGILKEGMSLLVKHQQDHTGLSSNTNGNRVSHIANLVVSDHPYHPTRKGWLKLALTELHQQLYQLIRYDGLRHVAFLARPLIYPPYDDSGNNESNGQMGLPTPPSAELKVPVLDWHDDIYPLLQDILQDLPRLRISVHVPKGIDIQ